jgi:hypothetical protein
MRRRKGSSGASAPAGTPADANPPAAGVPGFAPTQQQLKMAQKFKEKGWADILVRRGWVTQKPAPTGASAGTAAADVAGADTAAGAGTRPTGPSPIWDSRQQAPREPLPKATWGLPLFALLLQSLFWGSLFAHVKTAIVHSSEIEADGGRWVQTADGRLLEYFVCGDESPLARAVLYQHGYGQTGKQVLATARVCPTAARLGLRVISPSQPGFGLSSPYPVGGVRALSEWPRDVGLVLEQEAVGDFFVAGDSAGGVHALAVAHAYVLMLHVLMLHVLMRCVLMRCVLMRGGCACSRVPVFRVPVFPCAHPPVLTGSRFRSRVLGVGLR